MDKQYLVLCGPISTRSGYGEHVRDIFHSFYDLNMYDIKIVDTRWGDTPRNALDGNNPKDKLILDRISRDGNLQKQPDVYVDVRIPNEFQQIGKYNIGITAGIETNAVSNKWLEGCNKMDLIIVPSEHAKHGFMNTFYDKNQKMPDGSQQKVGELRLEKPIEVLFEGADEYIYKKLEPENNNGNLFQEINDMVKEKSAFLHVGQWCNGDFGEDRKDIGKLIKVFFETFSNKSGNTPALILKTSLSGFSILGKEQLLQKINDIKKMFPSSIKLPNVYLLYGDLKPEEMNELYNHPKIKCMVSFTHGEGFGRPLLEATMTGLPVIASNWSGHIDFLDEEYCILLSGDLGTVPKSAVWEDIIIPESQWFNVNEQDASKVLDYAFRNSFDMKVRSKKLMEINKNKFSHKLMTIELGKIMDRYTSHLPKLSTLKLPQLKQVKKESINELPKLPKLKKSEVFPKL
tara:strand:+ start:1574 stop:2950 length:1377 start_codon:yes stop_codon:yes gene_type:complete